MITYSRRTEKFDRLLQAALQRRGIGTEVYYPIPMHRQECFAYLGYGAGAFPESERAADETLAIPVHPELTTQQAEYVVDCIHEFFVTAGKTEKADRPIDETRLAREAV